MKIYKKQQIKSKFWRLKYYQYFKENAAWGGVTLWQDYYLTSARSLQDEVLAHRFVFDAAFVIWRLFCHNTCRLWWQHLRQRCFRENPCPNLNSSRCHLSPFKCCSLMNSVAVKDRVRFCSSFYLLYPSIVIIYGYWCSSPSIAIRLLLCWHRSEKPTSAQGLLWQ